MDFLREWIVPDLPSLNYQTYTFKNLGCSEVDKYEAEVHCFPKFKWEGKVSLGYGTQSGDKKRNEQNLDEKSEWKLTAGLNGEIGNESWELKTSSGKDSKQYFPGMMDTLRDFIDRMDDIAGSVSPKLDGEKEHGLVKFKLGWPQVSLAGDVKLDEMRGTTDVGLGGNLSLNMSPLLSAEVRTDILGWLIGCAGPHGVLLRDIKKEHQKVLNPNMSMAS